MAESKRTYRGLSKWIKIPVYFLLGIFLIALAARLSLKSAWVHNWVKNYALQVANKQLSATLEIERLSGDLWKEITISNLSLANQDTIASVDSVRIGYDIMSLLGEAFNISHLSIHKPEAKLIEEDGEWNVANLTIPSEEPSEPSEPFAFRIQDINIDDGFIQIRAPSVLTDTLLEITNMLLSANFGFYGERYEAGLTNLAFRVENTRLDQPVSVETSASANENTVTLEKLVLATGRSLLETSANVHQKDSVMALNIKAEPIAWRDIAAYSGDMPLSQDLKIDLGVRGTWDDFEVQLGAGADGLDSFDIAGRVTRDSSFALRSLQLNAGRFEPSKLIGDSTLPEVTSLRADFAGYIPFDDFQKGSGKTTLTLEEISRAPYMLSALESAFTLEAGSLSGSLKARNGKQQIAAELQAKQIWSDQPVLSAKVNGQGIDPAYWTQNSELAGIVNVNAAVAGKGWYPEADRWDYSLRIKNSRLMDQQFSDVSLRGKFNLDSVTSKGFVQLIKNRMDVDLAVRDLATNPSYDFKAAVKNFDVSEFTGDEEFTSSINGEISGSGRGYTPETLKLNTSIRVDSSIVNGEAFERFAGDFSIRDTTLIIEKAQLASAIAEGNFKGRYHLLRRYDTGNQLNFELMIKSIESLAPLAGVEYMHAEGSINGQLNPVNEKELQFLGNVDMFDLTYGDIYSSESAKGTVEVVLKEVPDYSLDLNLEKPAFPSVVLQDLRLRSNGSVFEETVEGGFKLQFSSSQEGEIIHSGSYSVSSDIIRVVTTRLDIASSLRTLSLQDPFTVTLADEAVRTDTLRVVSNDDEATMELAIPYADAKSQVGYLKGASLNTTVIQNALLSETLFEGILSGEFHFSRDDTTLEASGDILLSDFHYRGARFDTLSIKTAIKDERFAGDLEMRADGKRVVEGKVDLPFKLGDPEKFEQAFFEEKVSGFLDVKPVALNRFEQLLQEYGMENTDGIFKFTGTLKGKAGEPEFLANASLSEAMLSGVSVDSVTMAMNYQHESSLLSVNSSVISLRQKAAEIKAEVPLFVDLKSFEVMLPDEKDHINVDIETNKFNLAALNDFVDRRQVRNITGRLDGLVHVNGAIGDLKTDGRLTLTNGSLRVVQAGITVDRIQSTLVFDPNQIRLMNFSSRSGRGRLNAEGKLELEKLIPGDMDIRITADNFRAANTSEYNAIINMDTRSRGTFTSPRISGSLSFVSGFLELRNFGEKSVENVQLDSADLTDYNIGVYDSLSLDMDVSFNRRFFIRNQRYLEMQIELDGELDLVKEAGQPLQLFGTMNAASGYARPLGKRFDLQEGGVTFTGDPANPQLAVRTRYMPPQTQEDIEIWYIIEGTVEDPKFKYESNPPMELENIISYTLFGQPFYALDSWKQVVANSGSNTSAADVAIEVLLDRVESLATQRLGIDVVKIDNTRRGGESGTSITTGWYLNPKVFFAIQNVITGSTPDTGFLLEYILKKNLKLIITQENSTRQGVDLKWNFDY